MRVPFARSGGRLAPRPAANILLAIAVLLSLIAPCKSKLIANPLVRECKWIIDDEGLTDYQRSCARANVDLDQAELFVKIVQSEEWKLAFKIWGLSPFGIPKMDLVTIVRLITAKACGGEAKHIGASSLGVNLAYKTLVKFLNPAYLIPKLLSYLPKIGPTFKKVSDFFEKPSKKMDKLSDELDAKCKKKNYVLNSVNNLFKALGKIQVGFVMIDQVVAPVAVNQVCLAINAKVYNLIRKGGTCHALQSSRPVNGLRRAAVSRPASCSILPAVQPIIDVFNGTLASLAKMNSSIDEMNSIVQPALGPFQTIVDTLEDIADQFDPVVGAFEPYIGVMNALSDVAKYIKCPGDFLGPICNIQDLLEEGLNSVLDAFGVPNLNDIMDSILSALGLPDLDVDLDPLDFDFAGPIAELNATIEAEFENAFLQYIDTDIFDPSEKLEQALSCGVDPPPQDSWSVHITTSKTNVATFTCPNQGTRPVVANAQFFRWSCVQDMTGLFRFPCSDNSNGCSVNFGQFSRCSNQAPSGSEEFPNVSPTFYQAVYYCVPNDTDPEVMPVLNKWDTDHFRLEFDGEAFPVWKGYKNEEKSWYFTAESRNHPKEVVCNSGRVLDIDRFADITRKCYGAYYNISDSLEIYRKDLCAWDFNYRSFDPERRESWEKRDALKFSWSPYPTRCNKPPVIRCGPTDDCPFGTPCDGFTTCTFANKIEYLDTCAGDPSITTRREEYDKRLQFAERFYADEGDLNAHCQSRYLACDGSTNCNLEGCELDFFDWACVDPRSEYPAASVTHHFADSKSQANETISCQLGRKLMFARSEFGSGFDIMDASTAIESISCDTDGSCTVSAQNVASKIGVPPDGQTLRLETICSCAAGYSILPDANDECIPCEHGFYRTEAMSTCELVPPGYYSNQIESQRHSAYPCLPGTYSDIAGGKECLRCSAGTFSPEQAAARQEDCLACPVGMVSQGAGNAACEYCGPGSEPNEQQTECIACIAGYATPGNGTLCEPCNPGLFVERAGEATCMLAPRGTFQPNRASSDVKIAPIGHYVNQMGQIAPSKCPDGYTTVSTRSTDISQCVEVLPASCPEESAWRVSTNTSENCQKLLDLLDVPFEALGDSFCQPCLNVEDCDFDLGDCCPESCEKTLLSEGDAELGAPAIYRSWSCDPTQMQCLAPRANSSLGNCSAQDESTDFEPAHPCPTGLPNGTQDLIGNGICNEALNTPEMCYDGGDCCVFTCIRREGIDESCAPNDMNCKDQSGLIDKEGPMLFNLPPDITVSCRTQDIPDAPNDIYATDNDPCFDAIVDFAEWTNIDPPTCSARKIWRKWNATDPQGNMTEHIQTITVQPDLKVPDWINFPDNKTLLLAEPFSPDHTGWPTIYDSCQPEATVEYRDRIIVPDRSCAGEKVIEREWIATDVCGLTTSRKQVLSIVTHDGTNAALFDASVFQIFSSAGNARVKAQPTKGKSSKADRFTPNVQGNMAAAIDLEVSRNVLLETGCDFEELPLLWAGEKVLFNPESLPVHRKRSQTAAVIYGRTTSKSAKNRYLPEWSKQIDRDTAAAWFNDQMSKLTEVSSRFFNDPVLPRLNDGATMRTCKFVHANAHEKSTILCTSGDILSDTTLGDVSVKADGTVVLKAKHPVFNIFHIQDHEFFAMRNNKDLIVEIDGTEDATIIINVQKSGKPGKSSKSKKCDDRRLESDSELKMQFHPRTPSEGQRRKVMDFSAGYSLAGNEEADNELSTQVQLFSLDDTHHGAPHASAIYKSNKCNQHKSIYYPARYSFPGNFSSGQILVNFQHNANDMVEIYGQPGQAALPFSVMLQSDVKLVNIGLQGQLMAGDVYIKDGNVTCPLFHGSYPCDVEKLHNYPF